MKIQLMNKFTTTLLLTIVSISTQAQTPKVVTDTRFARGATMAFGHIKSAVVNGGPSIKKRGFCIAENPNPTIDDSISTKQISNSGTIYYFDKLKPATKYYMRAYATNNNNVTVEVKCSQLEKELITTDRRELQEILDKAGSRATS